MGKMFKPFIDVLYSIAIGIGFSEFPLYPQKNIPGVLFFLATLYLAAFDWYHYDKYESNIAENKKITYYITQIITILILSQLFRHSCTLSLKYWILYLVSLISIGTFWNIYVAFPSYKKFVGINIVIIIFNITLLAFYPFLLSKIPTSESNFRYLVFGFESILALVSYKLLYRIVFSRTK